MDSWNFESVYVGNGPVSTWSLASELADHGIRVVGWNEGGGGVWVGNLPRMGGYTGGTGIFAAGDDAGYSVMVLVFTRPTDIEVDIAGSLSAAPAFTLAGTLNGQDVYAGSWAASAGPREGVTVRMGEVTAIRLTTTQAAVGVPIDAYREVPSPGTALVLALSAAFAAVRRRA